MRFFIFLFQTSEKTRSLLLRKQTGSSIQQVTPPKALLVSHSILELGVGVGAVFSLLCAPALASSTATNTQRPSTRVTPATPELTSELFHEPASPELSYELPNEPTGLKGKSTLRSVPSLTASTYPTRPASLNRSARQYDDYYDDYIVAGTVAGEDNHRRKLSLFCELPSCTGETSAQPASQVSAQTSAQTAAQIVAQTAARKKEIVISDASAAAQLRRLLSQPAASHVGQAEIPTLELNDTAIPQSRINLSTLNRNSVTSGSTAVAQIPDFVNALPESKIRRIRNTAGGQPDDELGDLRLQVERSRQNEDLGILRLLQTAQAPPPPPKEPIAFLTGRLGIFDTDNVFRRSSGSLGRLSDQIFQSGLGVYLFPQLSDSTSLYAIAETSLARYENNPTILDQNNERQPVNYNQLELQLGLRQRLASRTYAQLGLRNQQIYTPGYRDKIFGANYIDAQINHRTILNSKTWLDGFYQIQLGFAESVQADRAGKRDTASRLQQTATLSLNYAATKDLRTSLLYQLNLDDYTQKVRYDTYQQVLGIISYNLTPESRLSLFAGTRFGRSSEPGVNLDDTFYGAGLNIVVPLF